MGFFNVIRKYKDCNLVQKTNKKKTFLASHELQLLSFTSSHIPPPTWFKYKNKLNKAPWCNTAAIAFHTSAAFSGSSSSLWMLFQNGKEMLSEMQRIKNKREGERWTGRGERWHERGEEIGSSRVERWGREAWMLQQHCHHKQCWPEKPLCGGHQL